MGMLIRNLTHGKTICYIHNSDFRSGSARVLQYVFWRPRLLRANEAKRSVRPSPEDEKDRPWNTSTHIPPPSAMSASP